MRERILAVFGAVALIALAVFARSQFVDSSDGGGGRSGSRAAERPIVACTPDLVAICAALAEQGQIAEDPRTLDLDQAANPEKDIDGWITWSPAPEVAELDTKEPTTWSEEMVLGSAPLGVLADPVTLGCTQRVAWSCLVQRSGTDFAVGVGDVTTAEGLARIAPLAPSLARDGDPTDVDTERGRDLLDGPTNGQDDAASMLRVASRPGALSAVIAPRPAVERAAATPQVRTLGLRALSGQPSVRAAVVLVSRKADLASVAASAKTDGSADALTALGLELGGTAPDVDAGALWQLRLQLR